MQSLVTLCSVLALSALTFIHQTAQFDVTPNFYSDSAKLLISLEFLFVWILFFSKIFIYPLSKKPELKQLDT